MVLETIAIVAIGVVVGGLLALLGLALTVRGLGSARNAYVALLGDETTAGDLDPDADTATVKLSGTVEDVPEPVETVEGRQAAVYRLKAVAKNYWNLLRKRRGVRQVLAEAAHLGRAVVADGAGDRWELTAAPVDENRRWGGVQEATSGFDYALKRPDVATSEWTKRNRYADEGDVPRRLRDHLAEEYDEDVADVIPSFGSFVVGEDVVEEGDRVRVAGTVEPTTEATAERAAAADGGAEAVTVNLTPGATLTAGSWRTLAWTELKSAVRKLPVGLAALVGGVVVVVAMLGQAGLVSLGFP